MPSSQPDPAMPEAEPAEKPRIVIVATGGTIAGLAAGSQGRAYRPGALSAEALVAAVPGLAELAELRCRAVFALDSVDLDLPRQAELAAVVAAELADPGVDGVVVTHGTDTLEESAYLLHLSLTSDKPVVVVGSMHPADAVSADGPGNLLGAVRVAADPGASGLGTLVVVGQDVYTARGLRKVDTVRTAAFSGRHTALAEVVAGQVLWYARPVRSRGTFAIEDLPESLPLVELLVSRADLPTEVVAALVAGGARGIVHLGPGSGNVPAAVAAALDRARRAGVVVVRASRVAAGPVSRNGAVDDDAHDWVAAGDLSPYQARVLLALALTRTSQTGQIQQYFDTH